MNVICSVLIKVGFAQNSFQRNEQILLATNKKIQKSTFNIFHTKSTITSHKSLIIGYSTVLVTSLTLSCAFFVDRFNLLVDFNANSTPNRKREKTMYKDVTTVGRQIASAKLPTTVKQFWRAIFSPFLCLNNVVVVKCQLYVGIVCIKSFAKATRFDSSFLYKLIENRILLQKCRPHWNCARNISAPRIFTN